MCRTLETKDGTTDIGTVSELKNCIGKDCQLILYSNNTEDAIGLDACLCQINLDVALRINNIRAELDESAMYYVID